MMLSKNQIRSDFCATESDIQNHRTARYDSGFWRANTFDCRQSVT